MSDNPNAAISIPSSVPPSGTIDITNIVANIKSTWIKWGVNYVFGLEMGIPGLQWVSLPILSTLDKAVIEGVLTLLANSAEMGAFFLNTAIKKASQAQDYVDAVNAKNSLPPTATDDEVENAEKKEMATFRNFVLLSN